MAELGELRGTWIALLRSRTHRVPSALPAAPIDDDFVEDFASCLLCVISNFE